MQGLPRREDAEIKPFMKSVAIKEIELDPSEMKALDKIAEEICRHGISWNELKAELGL
jgi:glycerol dehydrogenase-like iron-containing ADH family enzyme